MSVRTGIAKVASAGLTWGLRNIARRPAGNFPGKVAIAIDPKLIAELRWKLKHGSIVVVGTNGKTTVTNMIADVVEKSGQTALCNRTGANLDSGIVSALLQGKPADWGVIECDELWLAKVLPDLRPTYVLLLNLFRDQLDRCGEIDRIQESIAGALISSPETTLIYNADDPLCAYVARLAEEGRVADGGRLNTVAFGVSESMNLAQNVVADATMCQVCSHMFEYGYRQYGQLGSYSCPSCGFARPVLDVVASDVTFAADGLSFDVAWKDAAVSDARKAPGESSVAKTVLSSHGSPTGASGSCGTRFVTTPPEPSDVKPFRIHTQLAGSYMVYNLLAVYTASTLLGCTSEDVQKAIDEFDPKNGRLQEYFIDGRRTLLNLAKNPTGFNQNLRIVAADEGIKAVAFFINDQVVDGHDISWIWDIDFEELVAQPGILVFAGGSRRNDLQVRLKYAGVKAQLIDGIADVYTELGKLSAAGEFPADAPVYAIANYSALPPVKAKLDEMAGEAKASASHSGLRDISLRTSEISSHSNEDNALPEVSSNNEISRISQRNSLSNPHCNADPSASTVSPVVIAHILPDLLNLYGDGGNVRILEQRLRWRGIPVEVRKIQYGDPIKFDDVDLVFLGGGPDREQKLATAELEAVRDEFAKYLGEDGPLLAICGGYQILGRTWLLGDDEVPGLQVFDFETRRPGTSADRLVDNIALKTHIAKAPVIGYENHAGRTYLDDGVAPFGSVVSKTGKGNNDDGGQLADGVMQGNVIGTYLHGTLLAKNPEVADWLLARALERHSSRTGEPTPELSLLDDSEELAANAFMAKKLVSSHHSENVPLS